MTTALYQDGSREKREGVVCSADCEGGESSWLSGMGGSVCSATRALMGGYNTRSKRPDVVGRDWLAFIESINPSHLRGQA
jgi:hypothetical protein